MEEEQEEMSPNLDHLTLLKWTESENVKQEYNNMCKEEFKVEPAEESNQEEEETGQCLNDKMQDDNNREKHQINNGLPKKAKYSYKKGRKYKDNHPSTQKGHKFDLMITKLTREAPISEQLHNLCLYQCPKCDQTLSSWKILDYHLRKKHFIKKTSIAEISKSISKVVCYQCKICSDKLVCDKHFIKRHLNIKHKMLLSQYKDKYPNNKKLPPVVQSKNIIGNLCVFECKECKATFNSRDRFSEHRMKTSHFHESKESKESLIKYVTHKCQICKTFVLCDKASLRAHFKKCHDVSLDDYCKIAGCTMVKNRMISQSFLEALPLVKNIDNSCVYGCNVCNRKYHTSSGFRQHYRDHKLGPISSLSEYVVKGFSYKCPKCFKLLLCDKEVFQRHMIHAHGAEKVVVSNIVDSKRIQYDTMCKSFIDNAPVSHTVWNTTVKPTNYIPISEITPKIGNLCTFTCPKCDFKDFFCWYHLRRHYKDVHDCQIKYMASLVSVARCHSCLICPKAILCDQYFLAQHIYNVHKLSLKEYEETYRRNGGEVLPKFNDWLTAEFDENE